MSNPISRERALLIGFATVAFGVVTLMRKVALGRINPIQFEIVSGIVHVMLIPVYLRILSENLVQQNNWDRVGIAWTTAAILLNVLGGLAFMYALQLKNDVGVVASLSSASPIITLMLSALFLGEQPTMKSVIGIGFVLFGVLLASH